MSPLILKRAPIGRNQRLRRARRRRDRGTHL